MLRCISTNTTWSIRVELVAVEKGVRALFHLCARCIITTGRVSLPPKCLSIHRPAKLIHAPRLSLCNCMPRIVIFLSNVKHRVFLLRSKVNKKDHGLTTANMDSGFSFGVGRNLDSCSICTDQVRNWGSKCHFSTFYFILFCVHLHFQWWKCYFYCTFWYLLNLMYCMVVFLHVYWIYRWARAFEAHK